MILIASQLGEDRDRLIHAMTADLPVTIAPIARGPVTALPHQAEILFACPFHAPGAHAAPRPDGWPFGLDWIQLISTGIDPYPDWLFDAPLVTHGGGAMAAPIAEFCLALIFAAAKQLPQSWISEPGEWRLRPLGSVEGATLGIFGMGAIGEQLAGRALALGMQVRAVRRSDTPLPPGVERDPDIAALAAISDHLVLAAPTTAETRHIVSRAVLSVAKPGLHLINVARGALVCDEALIEALDSGRVGLASLDVTEPEPLPAGHPFYTHPRVRLSPHTSAMTHDGDERLAKFFVANLRRFLAREAMVNVVRP